jgi:hypothetical protein
MVIQSGKSNTVLFPKRLEQKKVSLSETSLDGQRLLGTRLGLVSTRKIFHVKLNDACKFHEMFL